MQEKKQQLEPDMDQQMDSKLGKKYVKAVLSPCLFYLHAEWKWKWSHSVMSDSLQPREL